MEIKMKSLKIFFIFLLLIVSLSLVSAQPPFQQATKLTEGYTIKIPEQGTVKQSEDYTFHFHVFNISNGLPIDDSSTNCTFHLYGLDGSHIVNQIITHDPGNVFNEWDVDVVGANFSELGGYSYIIQCNSSTNNLGGFESVGIEVTPTGLSFTSADSILYSLFSIILFGIIFAMFFFIFTLPSSNEKDEGGFEVKVVKAKYFRVLFIAMTYPLIVVLLNFLNGLAVNYSSLSMFAGTLGFLFEAMLRISWGFTIIMIAWIIVMLVKDTNLKRKLKQFEGIRIP